MVIEISDSDSDSEIEATYPKKIIKRYDRFDLIDNKDGGSYLRQTYHAATNTDLNSPRKIEPPSLKSNIGHSKVESALTTIASASGPARRKPRQERIQSSPISIQPAKKKNSKIIRTANKKGHKVNGVN